MYKFYEIKSLYTQKEYLRMRGEHFLEIVRNISHYSVSLESWASSGGASAEFL